MVDAAAGLLEGGPVHVEPGHPHVPAPEELAAVEEDHAEGERLLAGRAAGGEGVEPLLPGPRLALLDRAQHVGGEHVELRLLAEEVGLVVGEVAHHALLLLGPLRGEAQVAVVVLEGEEARGGRGGGRGGCAGSPAATRRSRGRSARGRSRGGGGTPPRSAPRRGRHSGTSPRLQLPQGARGGLADLRGGVARLLLEQRPQRLAEAAVAERGRGLDADRRARVVERRRGGAAARRGPRSGRRGRRAAGAGRRRASPRRRPAPSRAARPCPGGAAPRGRPPAGRGRRGRPRGAPPRAGRGSRRAPPPRRGAPWRRGRPPARRGRRPPWSSRCGRAPRPRRSARSSARRRAPRGGRPRPAGRRSRRGPPPRPGAGCGRRRAGPPRGAAPLPGARICPSASTAAKRSSLRGSARSGSRCSTASGLRIWPRARTAANRRRGSGSASSGSSSGADSGSRRRPRASTACWRTIELPSASPARSTSRTPGPPSSPSACIAAARSASRPSRDAATSAGVAAGSRRRPSVCAARTRASASSPARACTRSGRTRSALIRESASMALSWMSSLSSPSSSKSSMGASSSPSWPIAAAASARTSAAGSWMSGATSAVPVGRRDPGQAAHRPEANGVVRVREPALPGRALAEADRDEGVARELAHGGVPQELEERRHGPALAQPAEGDGGGAPVAGVLVGQHPEEVGHELLAPERGLDLGVEALAGGGRALLDLDHRPDRGVAQRGVGVEEVGGDARRAPRARPARPRASSAGARSISSSSRARSAGAARGSPISPRACSAGYWSQGSPRSASMSRGTASGRADLPEAGGGRVADVDVRVGERLHQGGDRGRLLHGAEHHRGEEPDLLVGVGEEGQERRRRRGPEPHVDLHRRVARARVVAVAQRRLEGGQERLGGEAGQGLDRGLPHRPALVPHRHEQRGDRLRAARGAELRDRPAPRGLLPAAQGVEGLGDVEAHSQRALLSRPSTGLSRNDSDRLDRDCGSRRARSGRSSSGCSGRCY